MMSAMRQPWHVDSLDIVGCADVLSPTMLPSVVPPVFRVRAEPSRVLVPPYSFSGGYLCNATEIAPSEIVLPAQLGHELWVDPSFGTHYEPREQAERTLRGIAARSVEEAEAAFARCATTRRSGCARWPYPPATAG